MSEPATDCDKCHGPIPYNETCYALPNGTTHDGLPVVRIVCAGCRHSARSGEEKAKRRTLATDVAAGLYDHPAP